jgi:hypothetical protein
MKTVILQNGRKVQISDESHDALERASRKRYKPEEGDRYWRITSWGSVIQGRWWPNSDHLFRYQNRNVFPSKEEAQAALDRLNKRNEILDRIEELNEGWEPDWEDYESKYFIEYLYSENWWDIDSFRGVRFLPNEYYFKSRAIGHQLIEEFGDALKVLFE